MKKGCLIGLSIFGILIIIFIIVLYNSFGPDYSETEIKQNIGGTLICNTVYTADHHSWQYKIDYKYKSENDSIFDIGEGIYYGREWNKDEQLEEFGDWTILKTGVRGRADKIIVGQLNSENWSEYELSPENIEREEIWKSSNIHSLINYCCSESYVTKIDKGQIELQYKFRIDRNIVEKMDIRKIIYQMDIKTGKPKMVRIQNIPE